jgi:3-oxoacyl-[acyl-carrier-protein] synthase III
MSVKITDIAFHLPRRTVTNAQLHADNPRWEIDLVAARSGVESRRVAGADETALDLAVEACRALLDRHPEARKRIDALLFCTQTPDHVMPPNSCLLQERLGLRDEVFAFDFTLACSGFVYGLGIAQGLIDGGIARCVLLVAADTYSRHIHPRDRSARVLFGDGAAVSLLEPGDAQHGMRDFIYGTSGKGHDCFWIPAGGARLPRSAATAMEEAESGGSTRTLENIHMNGMGVLAFVNSKVPKQVRALLERNQLSVDDVDLFVFHQASALALDALERALKIPPAKVYRKLSDIGNTVSASIPIALRCALDEGRVRSGDLVVLCGFGVGLSWASALVRM